MYLQIGDLVLEGLLGFTSLQESGESNFPEHALINTLPIVQFTGRKLTEMTGSIELHSLNNDINLVLATFKDYQENGVICPIIKGNGEVLGNFVLVSRRITHKQQDNLGGFVSCTLDLTIKEYSQIIKPNTSASNAFATSNSNAPVLLAPRKAAVSSSAQATIQITAAQTSGNAIGAMTKALKDDNARLFSEGIRRKVATVSGASAQLINITDADPTSSLYAITRDLANTTGQIISLCDLIDVTAVNCINAVDSLNTVSVLQCIDDLKNQTIDLDNLLKIQITQSAPLVALAASR